MINVNLVASLMPPTPFACSSEAQKWKVLSICVQLLSPYYDTFPDFGLVLGTFSGMCLITKGVQSKGHGPNMCTKSEKGECRVGGVGHHSVVKM